MFFLHLQAWLKVGPVREVSDELSSLSAPVRNGEYDCLTGSPFSYPIPRNPTSSEGAQGR
jgi:hypothetical protein